VFSRCSTIDNFVYSIPGGWCCRGGEFVFARAEVILHFFSIFGMISLFSIGGETIWDYFCSDDSSLSACSWTYDFLTWRIFLLAIMFVIIGFSFILASYENASSYLLKSTLLFNTILWFSIIYLRCISSGLTTWSLILSVSVSFPTIFYIIYWF
jgi:hypothetical protein